ncbi:MAG: hypothetical protein ACSHX6_07395 [Akkermansiaceae bacterium]
MKNLLSLSVPIGLILCGAGITALFASDEPSQEETLNLETSTIDESSTYYVFVSEIEVFNKALDDDNDEDDWDDDDDAPDLFYEIKYQGKKIFKSPQRDNTFIANWRGITLPVALKDLSSMIKGDVNINVDFEQIVNASRVKGNSEITLHMYDHDTMTLSDNIGIIPIHLTDLKEGTNVMINSNRNEDNGWKQIEIKVVKREGSVKDFLLPLLREMNNEQ